MAPAPSQRRGQALERLRGDVEDRADACARAEHRRPGVRPSLDQRQARVRRRPAGQLGLDRDRPPLAGQQQPATAAARQLERQRRGGADRGVERARAVRSPRASSTTSGRRVGVGLQPSLEQSRARGPAPANGSGRPASRAGTAAGRRLRPPPADRGPRRRPLGARGRRRRVPHRTRSVRGSTSSSCDGAARRAAHPREPERIVHDQARRRERPQPATRKARDDVHAGAAPPGSATACGSSATGSPASGSIELGAGQPERAAADLDRRLERLVLDHSVGVQPAREAGAAARSATPTAATSRPISDERDPRHEQRRGVERERDQVSAAAQRTAATAAARAPRAPGRAAPSLTAPAPR